MQNSMRSGVYTKDLSNAWMQNLGTCQKVLDSGNLVRQRQCWLEYEPDLRDILRADLLHRVWFTVLRSADIVQQKRHAEPIARSVILSHMNVRLRCLKLILIGHKFDSARMATLNELRKNVEMWSDFLCGHLAKKYDVTGCAFR